MKIWILILFLGFGVMANAQEVENNGTTYKVKGKTGKKIGSLI